VIKLLKILVLFISILILSACTYNNCIPKSKKISKLDVEQINIPSREHGYSNLLNNIIHSQAELNKFISDIKKSTGWNKKNEFLSKLKDANIDFESKNLIFYFHTETSGSIEVSLSEAIWKKNNAYILISRKFPFVQSDDMAYHGYAFIIKKTIPKLLFSIKKERVLMIENH